MCHKVIIRLTETVTSLRLFHIHICAPYHLYNTELHRLIGNVI